MPTDAGPMPAESRASPAAPATPIPKGCPSHNSDRATSRTDGNGAGSADEILKRVAILEIQGMADTAHDVLVAEADLFPANFPLRLVADLLIKRGSRAGLLSSSIAATNRHSRRRLTPLPRGGPILPEEPAPIERRAVAYPLRPR